VITTAGPEAIRAGQIWRGAAVRHLWRLLPPGTVESVNEHATDYGWAIDVIARRAAADAIAQLSARHQRRALPPAVNTAVYARFAELAEMMAPSHDEFEAAFDIAVHGTGEPV
jgi:hypothetical protein